MVFLDSNILLYLFGNDITRKNYVITLLNSRNTISTQVVGENINVCIRKLKLPKVDAFAHAQNLMKSCKISIISPTTIERAILISTNYGYSYWDSLMLAAALESNCKEVYSEDMHDGHIIEKKLKIVNPFKLLGI